MTESHAFPAIVLGALVRYSKAHRTEIALFASAFLLRAAYAFVVQYLSGEHGFIAFSDAEFFYYRLAKNMVEHGVYSLALAAPYYPEAYHTPLYPLFVSVFLLLKLSLVTVALAQACMGAAMASLSYRIAIRVSGSYATAVFTGIFMAIEPMSIFWSGLLMSDTLFAFLFILAAYLLSSERYLMSILVLALATLTRPFAMYCAPVFVLFMLWQAYKSGGSARRMIRDSALVLGLFCVVISPWIIRNQIVFGKASLTSASWYVAYVLPFSEFVQDAGLDVSDALPALSEAEQYRRFSFEYEPRYRQAIFEAVKLDPAGFVFVYGRRSLYSFVSDRYEYLLTEVLLEKMPRSLASAAHGMIQVMLLLGRIFWMIVYLAAFLAVAVRARRQWWIFALSLIGLNALLSGGMNPVGTDMSRYSMPLYPFYIIFAGVGLKWISNQLSARRLDRG